MKRKSADDPEAPEPRGQMTQRPRASASRSRVSGCFGAREAAIAGSATKIDLAADDHALAIGELAKTYPEMDATRVGIYGWSNGGYETAMAILKRPDFFKAGVAGAPVADLRDYDALMERFVGPAPNPGYDKSSLLTWAARPPTATSPARPLLVIHGTADDNVYLVHSLKFAEAMARAGRPMQFMPLIGQTHMVSDPDVAAAVAKRTAEFLREHLR